MKKIIMTLMITAMLASCGKTKTVTVVGTPGQNGKDADETRLNDLEARVSILESLMTLAQTDIVANYNMIIANNNNHIDSIQNLQTLINNLDGVSQSEFDALKNDVIAKAAELDQVDDDLQDQIDALVSQLQNAQRPINITEINFNFNTTINNITQQNADLTSIIARLNALESNALSQQSEINRLNAELAALIAQVDALTNSVGNPPSSSVSGSCVVQRTQTYTTSKHYDFELTQSTGLVGDYKLILTVDNSSISSIGDNNGGTGFSLTDVKEWSKTPINNSTAFEFYTNTNNTNTYIETAKVVKLSDSSKVITCTVLN